jgi:hypothetical protein
MVVSSVYFPLSRHKTSREQVDSFGLTILCEASELCEFHNASPDSPRFPVRLEEWEKCWEEDERDADDHSDDNKPST